MKPNPRVEAELAALVDKWTKPMEWRKDYKEWKETRLNQENYQQAEAKALEGFSGKMLEVGCGMGGLSVALMLAGKDVTALDINPDYARITELRARRHGLKAKVVVGSAENLPFKAGSFDCVVCYDVLEHVESPEKTLLEIRRVLKPGGKCTLNVVNRFAFWDPHYHAKLVNFLPRFLGEAIVKGKAEKKLACHDAQGLSEMHYYTRAGFRKLATQCGFTQVTERQGLPWPKNLVAPTFTFELQA